MTGQPLFVSVTCSSTGHPGVGRFRTDQYGDVWLVAASRQRPGSSGNGLGSGGSVHGEFGVDESYPGCPSCRSDSLVHCGPCGSLGCFDKTWSTFHCPSCGNSGSVEYGIGAIQLSGLGQY